MRKAVLFAVMVLILGTSVGCQNLGVTGGSAGSRGFIQGLNSAAGGSNR